MIREGARAVVLVEGESDRAALLALAGRLGRDLDREGVRVVALGGATNAGRFLEDLGPMTNGRVLAGLYDAAEERFFRRGLERSGHGAVPGRDRLEELGFFACEPDLEAELIRGLGTDGVESVIEATGELASLRLLQRQPAQRAQSVEQQLHRFLGTRSGRKSLYAAALVEALDPARVPRPLVEVLDRVRH